MVATPKGISSSAPRSSAKSSVAGGGRERAAVAALAAEAGRAEAPAFRITVVPEGGKGTEPGASGRVVGDAEGVPAAPSLEAGTSEEDGTFT